MRKKTRNSLLTPDQSIENHWSTWSEWFDRTVGKNTCISAICHLNMQGSAFLQCLALSLSSLIPSCNRSNVLFNSVFPFSFHLFFFLFCFLHSQLRVLAKEVNMSPGFWLSLFQHESPFSSYMMPNLLDLKPAAKAVPCLVTAC